MGALDESDLIVLGQIVRTEDRVTALLEHAAGDLGWDDDVGDDWTTSGEAQIFYVADDAPPGSWVAERRDGAVYLLVSGAEWNDSSPVGQPHLYAGSGFSAKREERDVIARSGWPSTVSGAGLVPAISPDGVYVLEGRPLADVIRGANTLSDQVSLVVGWATKAIEAALAAPTPPDLAKASAVAASRGPSRGRRTPSAPRTARE